MTIPSLARVDQIVAITDPVLRNLEITYCYWQLSTAVAERTGSHGANWCSFALWASRQAGCTIRGEDLFDALRARLGKRFAFLHPIRSLWRALLRRGLLYPNTRLGRAVRAIHSPFDAFERASEAVGLGNRKVFAEIGWHFARYLQECQPGSTIDSAEFKKFLDGFVHGDPPDGQTLLKQAFEEYASIGSNENGSKAAERLLRANLLIGLHEQTRLQDDIQASLESPAITAEDLGRRLVHVFLPGRILPRLLLRATGVFLLPFARFSRAVTRYVITERLMTLAMPGRNLRLSEHLAGDVPESLKSITEAGLVEFVGKFEPDNCKDCGASDWASLPQRMHFILHLFRCFQENQDLLVCPFTTGQVSLFRSGRIPDGRL